MEAIFTFNTTHEAITSERILLEECIQVKVMPLPASLGAGCGLCLRVAPKDLSASKQLLQKSRITPQAMYYKTNENGKTTYNPVIISDTRV